MNVFATDIDRSLIFSEKFINPNGIKPVCVEKGYMGENISYMLPRSLRLLHDLIKERSLYIIPVTTRSIEQFQRIGCLRSLNYVITSNGGVILHNGHRLKVWDDIIQKDLLAYKDIFGGIPNVVRPYADLFEKDIRCVDDVFYYVKLKDDVERTQELLAYLEDTLDIGKWTVVKQGLKLYITPSVISKKRALEFVLSKLNYFKLFTCGDGKMDKDFVLMGDVIFIPNGSEILEYLDGDEQYISLPAGLEGTIKLLDRLKIRHERFLQIDAEGKNMIKPHDADLSMNYRVAKTY